MRSTRSSRIYMVLSADLPEIDREPCCAGSDLRLELSLHRHTRAHSSLLRASACKTRVTLESPNVICSVELCFRSRWNEFVASESNVRKVSLASCVNKSIKGLPGSRAWAGNIQPAGQIRPTKA